MQWKGLYRWVGRFRGVRCRGLALAAVSDNEGKETVLSGSVSARDDAILEMKINNTS